MSLLNDLLVKSSKDYPDKEAIVCGNRRMTFSEIEISAAKLSNFLISQGVEQGDRIGLLCSKDLEEVIIILATLKIGAVFIYINPQYREEQIFHVINDCELKAIFIDKNKFRLFNRAYPSKSPVNFIVSLSSDISLSNDFENLYYFHDLLNSSTSAKKNFNEISDNRTASIIYTSGSTGKAKGIIVTHKIFYDSTIASVAVLENIKEDRLISVTPFSFDGALSQLFTMFMVGGTLVQQKSSFPKDIVDTLLNEKISGFHAMPSLWNILLQKHSPFTSFEYPYLRYISIIGENMPSKYLNIIKSTLTKTKIYKMYGTTEAFRSTYLPPEDLETKPDSVGIAFPGVKISVVDERNEICKSGNIGEIIHNGNFVSPGYWNQPKKTVERFKSDGLHTGDFGKIDDDGYLYFVGRKDGMIKVQGFRVSPEEIEDCLYQIQKVQEAAVISVPGENLDRKIKAIIVCKNKNDITENEIISHCRLKLPNYMVPALVEFREFLPRTANNKVNKLELIKTKS